MPLTRPYRWKWKYFKQIGYVPRSGQKLLHWAADYYRYIGFFAYPRGGKCLWAYQLVYAKTNGKPKLLPVRKIEESIRHYKTEWELPAPDGTWKKILRIEKQPDTPLIILRFRDGSEVRVTEDHKFVIGGELVEAKRLVVGQVLDTCAGRLPDEAGCMDLDFAWLAGLFLAEGCYIPNEASGITFSLHEKETAVTDRLSQIAARFGATVHTFTKKGSRGITAVIYNRPLRAVIEQLITGKGSSGKHFTQDIWAQSNKFLEVLLRAYLDGDGYAPKGRKGWQIGFTGKNKYLPDDLRLVCSRLGWRCSLNLKQGSLNGKPFTAYKGWIGSTPQPYNRPPTEIVSITQGRYRNGTSYELAIEPDHLYVLPNGVVTHNSYGAAMEVAATVNEPDYHCWIVAPTYPLGAKEFGYIYQAHLASGHLQKASHVSFNIKGGDMRIEYPWGWWVEVKSAERPHLILAEEVDELVLAEGPRLPESLWQRSLYNRVEKRRGRTYVPATPMGQNWVKGEFYDRAQKELDGQRNPNYDREYWAIRVSHLEEEKELPNVHVQGGVYSSETIERARAQMAPQVFREQFGGDFVSYAGTVYDPSRVKRIKPFEIPKDWHVVIGYDHGASGRRGGMTAITFIAWDNERPRNAYLYKMVYAAGHGANWYIAEIRKRLELPNGEQRPYDIIVVDPSAKQVRIELMGAGLVNTTPEVHDFKARYIKMSGLLEEGRLYVFDTDELKKWWYEIARYEWKEGVKGEPRGDQVQGPDDAMDSTGYALLYTIPAVTDEEVESAAEKRSELVKIGVTKLTENEKRAWRRVREEREEEEQDTIELPDEGQITIDDFFEED